MAIFGTRPEAIKLAPVIRELRRDGTFTLKVLATAQHREMLDQVLGIFSIEPDYDLDLMTGNQGLTDLTARSIRGIGEVLERERPDMVVIQGDTTTVFAAALAAYYCKIPVCHVEAGLRTSDKYSPFPEEGNRRIATVLSDLHCAPTGWARENLIREGVPAERIHVTGNTVIDALEEILRRPVRLAEAFQLINGFLASVKRMVLVTAHRRESFGVPFFEMCGALRELADAYPDTGIIYPVHPNPQVRQVVKAALRRHPRVLLIEPLEYPAFVALMQRAYFVLTDSGGVQEEAPSLRKPVLIMRETTERPEGVEAGVARLVGSRRETIVREASRLLESEEEHRRMATGANPFGDGRASQRIVRYMGEYLEARR
ncbi:MAG: UDP-N-acetylglucosamine 2-epimerase (non-hydrolyzing) [Thermodesulfovibrionales bacterium]